MIPAHVKADLKEAEYSDEQIALMSPQEVFEAYCTWHGLLNWSNTLWQVVTDLQKE